MEKSVVILGLSRQAKFLGLPMPYAMAVGGLTVMPFIITKLATWMLTAPVWYLGARAITARNPNAHRVLATILAKTPRALFKSKPRFYSETRLKRKDIIGRASAIFPKDRMQVYQQLPYLVEATDEIVRTRDNALMLSFEIEGIDGVTADPSAIVSLRGQFADILNGLDGRFTFYIHRAMRPATPKLAPILGDGFAADVERAWRIETQRREPREHFLVLTLVRRQDGASTVPIFAQAARKMMRDDTDKRCAELTELGAIIRASMPIKAKPMQVSDGTLLGFYATILTGNFEPVTRGAMSLVAEDVARASCVCRADHFVLDAGDGKARFGAVLYCTQYAPATWAGMLDNLDESLNTIITHSFTPLDRNTITERVKLRVAQMQAAGDLAARVQAELFEAADDAESGLISFGEHQMTITVFGESKADLDLAVRKIRGAAQQASFKFAREASAVEATLFSTHPGNMDHRCHSMILSSRNFADLAAFHTADAGAVGAQLPWRTPITAFETLQGSTQRFSFHEAGDPNGEPTNGHTLVLGPSGGGKTATIAFLVAQAQRAGVQTILFDKEFGLKMPVAAMGGTYAQIRAGQATGFNPLLTERGERGEAWLLDWLVALLERTGPKLTPQQSTALASAIRQNMNAPENLRNFRQFQTLIGDAGDKRDLAMRVAEWGPRGRYEWVFGEAETPVVDFERSKMTAVDLTEILDLETERTAVLAYLFRRIDTVIEQRHPTLVIIDEAWKVLNDDYFREKLKDWLVTARKKNVVVVMMTQFPSQIYGSKAKTILESLPTQILFPNRKAEGADYDGFSLTESEVGFVLAGVTGKRAVLMRSTRGSSVLNVDLTALGPLLTVLGGGAAGEAAFGKDFETKPDFWKA